MSRYIDYDAIDYRNDRLHDKSEEFLNGVIYMAQRIEEAPSIDIVRCKECKHFVIEYVENEYGKDDEYPMCLKFEDYTFDVKPDDFCSYGQKGDENVETD